MKPDNSNDDETLNEEIAYKLVTLMSTNQLFIDQLATKIADKIQDRLNNNELLEFVNNDVMRLDPKYLELKTNLEAYISCISQNLILDLQAKSTNILNKKGKWI
jgi:hypothetical protein